MKCPVELASDLSAEGVDRVNPSGGRRDDEGIPGRRLGAGDADHSARRDKRWRFWGFPSAAYGVGPALRDYEQHGYDGLFDRRRSRPSPKRVPVEVVEAVLRLYQERYPNFNVRHFHEKLREEHGIRLSYT